MKGIWRIEGWEIDRKLLQVSTLYKDSKSMSFFSIKSWKLTWVHPWQLELAQFKCGLIVIQTSATSRFLPKRSIFGKVVEYCLRLVENNSLPSFEILVACIQLGICIVSPLCLALYRETKISFGFFYSCRILEHLLQRRYPPAFLLLRLWDLFVFKF